MIQKLGNKLQVQLEGTEGAKRTVSFSNVVEDPVEEKILVLGDVVDILAQDSATKGVILTTQTRYTK
ncbi:hypothetical protein [Enterococcus devriesei]|uniref:hypothetical protein n=1 Tax=Enterococcus devriesei TaxID=319970 RepID=UPI0036D23A33